jgi:Ca-activated chloride channel homolog
MIIRKPHVLELVLSFLIGLLALAVSSWGNEATALGSIEGMVVDQEEAPLPGVSVTVSARGLIAERTVVTDPDGKFEVERLPAGRYRVEAKLAAFHSDRVDALLVSPGQTTRVRLMLHLEVMQTTVEVVACAAPSGPEPSPAAPIDPRTAPVLARVPGVDVPVGLEVPVDFQRPAAARTSNKDTEEYALLEENPIVSARQFPLSTFSIDVDTASYANIRRYLKEDEELPPPGAVRIEELVNYFRYEYPQPRDGAAFSVNVEVAACPWQAGRRLARIGLQGREIPVLERPSSNLVFLIDVSGSMDEPDKLPLLRQALKTLVVNLGSRDRVAIVVYAGSSGLVLPPTGNKRAMLDALDQLDAGGSTNGGEGIELAYKVAQESFVRDGNNRVILCTDGDFNVGMTDRDELTRLIQDKAKSGVFLSVLGFGSGALDDATMEALADKGNGNYSYIDTLQEARKVLGRQMGATLFAIAKDVKIQVEFNPAQVAAYRLIGYENRLLRAEDFNDDKKDAGEIGAGHSVTALYEIVPARQGVSGPMAVDPLKYQRPAELSPAATSGELFTLKLRAKEPAGDTSRGIELAVKDAGTTLAGASADFKFAAAVAAFGMLLRGSDYRGSATLDLVQELASAGRGPDPDGSRGEFIQLVKLARSLQGQGPEASR